MNFTFDTDKSFHIPINITYFTDAPENLTGNIFSGILETSKILYFLISTMRTTFWMQRNLIFFGENMPQQVLQLYIINQQEWAKVRIMTSNISVDIPMNNKDVKNIIDPTTINKIKTRTDLIISPLEEAPSEPFSILLEITCPSKGILKEAVFYKNIEFTPTFKPKIEVIAENSVKRVAPRTPININIKVKNYGNKITKVTPKLKIINESWHPEINPSKYEISTDSEGNFTLSLISPDEFGWHNKYETFEIVILSEIFPYSENSGKYDETIIIMVNNYGFSTPGFELSLLIILIIIIIVNIRRRNK